IAGGLIQFAIEGLVFFALGAEASTLKGTGLTFSSAPAIYAVALIGNTITHGLILGAIPLFPTVDALQGRVKRLLAPEAFQGVPRMIKAENFTFRYPTREEPALENLSFEVEGGEVLGVVGPVEAGKTSLSMALAGFAPSVTGGETSGELEVAGRDPREADDNKVAMVFEDYSSQLTQIRIIDEVVAPLVNNGVPRDEAVGRAREL
ncbi:MAG: ATP-binding cassette domain-containing protein, partial [Halobacteria archaeon]|nr:ATP-binding cassette domain-containing protein [Halobacteria archaeon]